MHPARKRTLGLLAALVLLGAVPAADVQADNAGPQAVAAAGLHEFRVREDLGKILYRITVCTRPGRRVLIRFRAEDQNGRGDTDVTRARQRFRCTEYSSRFNHNFPSGEYFGRIKVRIPSTGYSRFTRWRSFVIE
jgi:hypothetical protein